jgi:hypothetical protein
VKQELDQLVRQLAAQPDERQCRDDLRLHRNWRPFDPATTGAILARCMLCRRGRIAMVRVFMPATAKMTVVVLKLRQHAARSRLTVSLWFVASQNFATGQRCWTDWQLYKWVRSQRELPAVAGLHSTASSERLTA